MHDLTLDWTPVSRTTGEHYPLGQWAGHVRRWNSTPSTPANHWLFFRCVNTSSSEDQVRETQSRGILPGFISFYSWNIVILLFFFIRREICFTDLDHF